MATAPTKKTPARSTTAVREHLFVWEGKDKTGKIIRGEMRATTETVVQTVLRRQGILAHKIRKQAFARGRKIDDKDIALFTRQLATMMRSGVPLLQSFDIAIKGCGNPSLARLLNDVRANVETGSSLSQAFRRHPDHFDALFCNLVAAGEQAGILDALLDRLATYKEKILAIKSKIKSALFYPISVVVVAALVVSVMMLFVVPEFKKVFASFGADLPAPTMLVIAVSDFFVEYWYIGFGLIFGAIIGISYTYKHSPQMQATVDRLTLQPRPSSSARSRRARAPSGSRGAWPRRAGSRPRPRPAHAAALPRASASAAGRAPSGA